jgi:hypothetical protein
VTLTKLSIQEHRAADEVAHRWLRNDHEPTVRRRGGGDGGLKSGGIIRDAITHGAEFLDRDGRPGFERINERPHVIRADPRLLARLETGRPQSARRINHSRSPSLEP